MPSPSRNQHSYAGGGVDADSVDQNGPCGNSSFGTDDARYQGISLALISAKIAVKTKMESRDPCRFSSRNC